MKLTHLDDSKDAKRRKDIEREVQSREHQHFDSEPAIGRVRNYEVFFYTANGTDYLAIRVGDSIKKIALS